MLQLPVHLCSFSLDLFHCIIVYFVLGNSTLNVVADVLLNVEHNLRISSLELPAMYLVEHVSVQLAFCVIRAYYWFMFNLLYSSTPRSIPVKPLSIELSPTIPLWGMILRCRMVHLFWLNSRFLPAYLSSLLVPQNSIPNSLAYWLFPFWQVPPLHLQFRIVINVLRGHSASSGSLIKRLTNSGPWRVLLTGYQLDFISLMTTLQAFHSSCSPNI